MTIPRFETEFVEDEEEKGAMSYCMAEASLESGMMMFSTNLSNSAKCGEASSRIWLTASVS